MAIDLVNMILDVVWPPAAFMLLATLFPAVLFGRFLSWLYNFFFPENMHNKVVIITGASSGIGEVSQLGVADVAFVDQHLIWIPFCMQSSWPPSQRELARLPALNSFEQTM